MTTIHKVGSFSYAGFSPRGEEEGKGKPTFNEEQQAFINELIKTKQGEAARELRTQLEETRNQFTTLQSELNEAKQRLQSATTPKQKQEAQGDIDALKTQLEEARTHATSAKTELENLRKQVSEKDRAIAQAKEEAMNVRKQVAMTSAASKVNFFDVGDVIEVTQKFVKWDDQRGKFIVTYENGQERMNASFEPMSLDEFFNEYAAKNPYKVRGDVKNGAGSSESQRAGVSNNGKFTVEQIFGKNSNGQLANELYKTNKAEYMRMRQIAVESGLLAG